MRCGKDSWQAWRGPFASPSTSLRSTPKVARGRTAGSRRCASHSRWRRGPRQAARSAGSPSPRFPHQRDYCVVDRTVRDAAMRGRPHRASPCRGGHPLLHGLRPSEPATASRRSHSQGLSLQTATGRSRRGLAATFRDAPPHRCEPSRGDGRRPRPRMASARPRIACPSTGPEAPASPSGGCGGNLQYRAYGMRKVHFGWAES